MEWPPWITPAMVLGTFLWLMREIRSLADRLATVEGRIASIEGRLQGWQDRNPSPPA